MPARAMRPDAPAFEPLIARKYKVLNAGAARMVCSQALINCGIIRLAAMPPVFEAREARRLPIPATSVGMIRERWCKLLPEHAQ